MNYKEAIEYLYSIPMFTKVGAVAYKPGYERISALDQLFGSPHRSYNVIHIAGTNGKGSSSSMIASVLMSAGYRVGLYTSPHLFDFRERIKVNGEMIDQRSVCSYVEKMLTTIETTSASFFEVVTAMAFDYFRQSKVDYAIIETGLGGEKDATNIVSPIATLITNIGYDHTAILGDTLSQIAIQKAGIIKRGVPLVISEWSDEATPPILQRAKEMNSSYLIGERCYHAVGCNDGVFSYENRGEIVEVNCDLKGRYQQKNIAGVLTLFDILRQEKLIDIDPLVVKKGVSETAQNTNLKGRWHKLCDKPLVICDTGHNSHGLKEIFSQIKSECGDNFVAVMGFAADKDIEQIFDLFPKGAKYIFTQAQTQRAISSDTLCDIAHSKGLDAIKVKDVHKAIEKGVSMLSQESMLFVGGSNFVVAEVDVDFFNHIK